MRHIANDPKTPNMRWIEIDKGDVRGRVLADRHYTRGSVGHPMWTRPGWNQCLYAEQKSGRAAVFCWWRPKWESGLVGTERKDGLRCIECSVFRNETRFRSSDLIRDAVACLLSWEHAQDQAWPDGIITGVNTAKTAGGSTRRLRSRQVLPRSRIHPVPSRRQEQASGRVVALHGCAAARRRTPDESSPRREARCGRARSIPMNTNWNQRCTSTPLRLEAQHDEQRESYEDAVEAEVVSREDAEREMNDPFKYLRGKRVNVKVVADSKKKREVR